MNCLVLLYINLPSSTAFSIVAKLESASTMSAASFATSVPLPIATPISAFFRAGASFTPSPVWNSVSNANTFVDKTYHCNNESKTLQEVHQFDLVVRFSSAEKGGFLDSNDFLCATEVVELAAGIALSCQVFICTKDPDAPTDAFRRSLVVSCDTDHTDTGCFTVCDGIASLRPGW